MFDRTVKWPQWKKVSFFQILYMKMPYGLVISLLGIYTKKTKAGTERDICTPIFVAALFTIAKIQKKPN